MPTELSHIPKNLDRIRNNVNNAALRVGRNPDDITIMAVTKTVGVEEVRAAIGWGVKIVGESRVQEAIKKHAVIGNIVEWHFIGPLQKNKAKFIPGLFSLVHSVDSYDLAKELDRRAGGNVVKILLEINIGDEESKHGFRPDEAEEGARKISTLKNLRLKGLMAIPPETEDPEASRPYFKRIVEIKRSLELLGLENADFDILSFGMTDDYVVAVEEGATHLRIGRGIFGER
jgi:hypothetical protein